MYIHHIQIIYKSYKSQSLLYYILSFLFLFLDLYKQYIILNSKKLAGIITINNQ